ncbi:hypothetical protein CEP51_003248 [Fusarium floridanum]|uniref:aldehyde dehydrogenase (NAD(+)) n=1 Tax=Fusarium floridanum TaxID=1325733 RepID=A0A428S7X2_9HYPO|nr:hypothetical protein CEP51_003248 [Fusarium floridanum]
MELRNPIHALLHEWHRPDILKVRCTFDAGTIVCTPCERRGAECIGQHLQPSDHCDSQGQSANYENLSRSLVQVEALMIRKTYGECPEFSVQGQPLASFDIPDPTAHPISIARNLLLIALSLQIREEVAPSSSKKMVLSQSTKESSHRYFNAATRNVTSKDQLSGIYDAFVSSYKALIEENTELVGNPDDPATLIGPLVDESQFNRVLGFMDRGSSQGFVAPTVFLDVPEDAEIMPCAKRFLAQSRSSIRIFTKDITRAMRFSAELDSGIVGINAVSTVFWQAPFGGTKESGIGRENGVHAIRSFTEPKTVFVNMNA